MRHETYRQNQKAVDVAEMFSLVDLSQRAQLFIQMASTPKLHKSARDQRFDEYFAVMSSVALVKRLRALSLIPASADEVSKSWSMRRPELSPDEMHFDYQDVELSWREVLAGEGK